MEDRKEKEVSITSYDEVKTRLNYDAMEGMNSILQTSYITRKTEQLLVLCVPHRTNDMALSIARIRVSDVAYDE